MREPEAFVRLGAAHARRRTFADAIVASALCMSAALRHPACACSHSPALGHGQPLAESSLACDAGRGGTCPDRRSPCLHRMKEITERGAAHAREPALLTSAARMAERSQHRASEGPEPVASVRRRGVGSPSRRGTHDPHRSRDWACWERVVEHRRLQTCGHWRRGVGSPERRGERHPHCSRDRAS